MLLMFNFETDYFSDHPDIVSAVCGIWSQAHTQPV